MGYCLAHFDIFRVDFSVFFTGEKYCWLNKSKLQQKQDGRNKIYEISIIFGQYLMLCLLPNGRDCFKSYRKFHFIAMKFGRPYISMRKKSFGQNVQESA